MLREQLVNLCVFMILKFNFCFELILKSLCLTRFVNCTRMCEECDLNCVESTLWILIMATSQQSARTASPQLSPVNLS